MTAEPKPLTSEELDTLSTMIGGLHLAWDVRDSRKADARALAAMTDRLVAEVRTARQRIADMEAASTAGSLGISEVDHLRARVADLEARQREAGPGVTLDEEERVHVREVRDYVQYMYMLHPGKRDRWVATLDRLLATEPRTVTREPRVSLDVVEAFARQVRGRGVSSVAASEALVLRIMKAACPDGLTIDDDRGSPTTTSGEG